MTAKLAPALIATLLLTLTAHAQTAPPPGIHAVVAKAGPIPKSRVFQQPARALAVSKVKSPLVENRGRR